MGSGDVSVSSGECPEQGKKDLGEETVLTGRGVSYLEQN